MRCKAYFPGNSNDSFAFYGPAKGPQMRIKHGQEFNFEFDQKKHELVEVNGKNMVATKTESGVKVSKWIVSLEDMKKKPGPKPKAKAPISDEVSDGDDNVVLDA